MWSLPIGVGPDGGVIVGDECESRLEASISDSSSDEEWVCRGCP